MSLPTRILTALAALAITFSAGWLAHARYRQAADAAAALAQSEASRESERLAARHLSRITDALTQDRLRSQRAAADAGQRLRQLAASTSAPPGCPGRNEYPRPAAAALHDDARADLVALASEADAVADRLRACQAFIQLQETQ